MNNERNPAFVWAMASATAVGVSFVSEKTDHWETIMPFPPLPPFPTAFPTILQCHHDFHWPLQMTRDTLSEIMAFQSKWKIGGDWTVVVVKNLNNKKVARNTSRRDRNHTLQLDQDSTERPKRRNPSKCDGRDISILDDKLVLRMVVDTWSDWSAVVK